MNTGHYEDFLIREATAGDDKWCSQCERKAEDCVCEEHCDWIDAVCKLGDGDISKFADQIIRNEAAGNTGEDVRVPASPVPLDFEHFGAESEPYTYEEVEARRREWNL